MTCKSSCGCDSNSGDKDEVVVDVANENPAEPALPDEAAGGSAFEYEVAREQSDLVGKNLNMPELRLLDRRRVIKNRLDVRNSCTLTVSRIGGEFTGMVSYGEMIVAAATGNPLAGAVMLNIMVAAATAVPSELALLKPTGRNVAIDIPFAVIAALKLFGERLVTFDHMCGSLAAHMLASLRAVAAGHISLDDFNKIIDEQNQDEFEKQLIVWTNLTEQEAEKQLNSLHAAISKLFSPGKQAPTLQSIISMMAGQRAEGADSIEEMASRMADRVRSVVGDIMATQESDEDDAEDDADEHPSQPFRAVRQDPALHSS